MLLISGHFEAVLDFVRVKHNIEVLKTSRSLNIAGADLFGRMKHHYKLIPITFFSRKNEKHVIYVAGYAAQVKTRYIRRYLYRYICRRKRLCWFGHVVRRHESHTTRQATELVIEGEEIKKKANDEVAG